MVVNTRGNWHRTCDVIHTKGAPFAHPNRSQTRGSRMDRIVQAQVEEEPIGIVISSGSRAEAQPRFWAYEWWPGPDESPEATAGTGTNRAA